MRRRLNNCIDREFTGGFALDFLPFAGLVICWLLVALLAFRLVFLLVRLLLWLPCGRYFCAVYLIRFRLCRRLAVGLGDLATIQRLSILRFLSQAGALVVTRDNRRRFI
ncbi:hypothetical protein D3C87_1774170 [compost metagenome]